MNANASKSMGKVDKNKAKSLLSVKIAVQNTKVENQIQRKAIPVRNVKGPQKNSQVDCIWKRVLLVQENYHFVSLCRNAKHKLNVQCIGKLGRVGTTQRNSYQHFIQLQTAYAVIQVKKKME